MRDFLFRGKRIDNGEWFYGDGLCFPKSFNYRGTCWIGGNKPKANDWIQVVPETIGQYTGLEDKHGNKIFEGDIVKSSYGVPYSTKGSPWMNKMPSIVDGTGEEIITVIEYVVDNKLNGVRIKGLGGVHNTGIFCVEHEIVGNKYDNPEMVKGKEKQ